MDEGTSCLVNNVSIFVQTRISLCVLKMNRDGSFCGQLGELHLTATKRVLAFQIDIIMKSRCVMSIPLDADFQLIG